MEMKVYLHHVQKIDQLLRLNGEQITKGSALISASWASLPRYNTYQSYMVLVTHTILYITAIAPVLCLVLISCVC